MSVKAYDSYINEAYEPYEFEIESYVEPELVGPPAPVTAPVTDILESAEQSSMALVDVETLVALPLDEAVSATPPSADGSSSTQYLEQAAELVDQLSDPDFVPADPAAAAAVLSSLNNITELYSEETAEQLAPALEYWVSVGQTIAAAGTWKSTEEEETPHEPVNVQGPAFFGIGDQGQVGTQTIGGVAKSPEQELVEAALVFVHESGEEQRWVDSGESGGYYVTEPFERDVLLSITAAADRLGLDASGAAAYEAEHAAFLLENGGVGTAEQFTAAMGRAPEAADRAFLLWPESTMYGENGSTVVPARYGTGAEHIEAVGHGLGVYEWLPKDVITAAQASTGGHVLLAASDQISTVEAHLSEQAVLLVDKLVTETVTNDMGESSYSYQQQVMRTVPMPTAQALAELGLSGAQAEAYVAANSAFILDGSSLVTAAEFSARTGHAPSDADRGFFIAPGGISYQGENGEIYTPPSYGNEAQYLGAIGLSSDVSRSLTIAFNGSGSGDGDAWLDPTHRSFDSSQVAAYSQRAYQAVADDTLAGKWVQIGDIGPIGDDVGKILGDLYEKYGCDTPEKQEALKSALFTYDERFGVLANPDLVAGAVEMNNNRRQGFFEKGLGRAILTVAVSLIPGVGVYAAAVMNGAFVLADGGTFGQALLAGAATYFGMQAGTAVGNTVAGSLVEAGITSEAVVAGVSGAANRATSSVVSQLIQTGEIDGDAVAGAAIAGGVAGYAGVVITESFGADLDLELGVPRGTTGNVLSNQLGSVASGNGLSLEGFVSTAGGAVANTLLGSSEAGELFVRDDGDELGILGAGEELVGPLPESTTTVIASPEVELYASLHDTITERYGEYLASGDALQCFAHSTSLAATLSETNPDLGAKVIEFFPQTAGDMHHFAVEVQTENGPMVIDLTADQFSLLADEGRSGPQVMSRADFDVVMQARGYQLTPADGDESVLELPKLDVLVPPFETSLLTEFLGAQGIELPLDVPLVDVDALPSITPPAAQEGTPFYFKDAAGNETWLNPETGALAYRRDANGNTLAITGSRSVLSDASGKVLSVEGGGFGEAFAQAKASGATLFNWNGKPFPTVTEQELVEDAAKRQGLDVKKVVDEFKAFKQAQPKGTTQAFFDQRNWSTLASAGFDVDYWKSLGFSPTDVAANYALAANENARLAGRIPAAGSGTPVSTAAALADVSLALAGGSGVGVEFGGEGTGSSFSGSTITDFAKNAAFVVTNWDKLPESVRAELRGTLISMGLGITQIGGLVDFGRMLITGKAVPFGEEEATFTDKLLAGAGALPFVKLGTAGAKAVDAFADAARILNITEDLVAAASVAPRGMTIAENLRPFLGTSTVNTVEQLLVSPGAAKVADAGAALSQTLTANFDQIMAAAAVPGKLTLAGIADAALWAKPSGALVEASAHSMPYTDLVTLWAAKNNLGAPQAFGAVTTQLDGTIAMVASGKWVDPVSGMTHNIEPAVQAMQLRQLVAAREELEIARAISDAGIKLKPGEIAADVLGRLPDAIVDAMQTRIDGVYKAAGIKRGG